MANHRASHVHLGFGGNCLLGTTGGSGPRVLKSFTAVILLVQERTI